MRYLDPHTPVPRLNQMISRGALRASALFGGRRYRRFVIVGVARTGSTLLLNLLNAHRQAIAFGELFRDAGAIGWDMAPFQSRQNPRLLRLHRERPLEFLETEVFRRWPREIGAVGFKLFYYHARTGAQAAIWDYLKHDEDVAVIHVRRLNILEQYLSLRVAHATDRWSTTTPLEAAPVAPMHLDPDDCRRHFEQVRAYEAECDALFADRAVRTVTYEDLAARRSAVMQGVCDYLGLAPELTRATIARQRTQPLSRAIVNYEALREHFAGTAWEDFFRQPDTVDAGQEAA